MSKVGKVYKIVCSKSNVVYVGSTFYSRLRQRWNDHKSNFKEWLGGKEAHCTIYPYFKKYGIENFKMILIKEYQVCDEKHLRMYEGLWISKTNCCNRINPSNLSGNKKLRKFFQKEYREKNDAKIKKKKKEYYQDNKEEIAKNYKVWRENNKEWVAQKNKIWRENNKEEIAQKKKETYLNNREEILKKKKEYWRKNREEIIQKNKVRAICECGLTMNKYSIPRHKKSNRHKKLMSEKQ